MFLSSFPRCVKREWLGAAFLIGSLHPGTLEQSRIERDHLHGRRRRSRSIFSNQHNCKMQNYISRMRLDGCYVHKHILCARLSVDLSNTPIFRNRVVHHTCVCIVVICKIYRFSWILNTPAHLYTPVITCKHASFGGSAWRRVRAMCVWRRVNQYYPSGYYHAKMCRIMITHAAQRSTALKC